jgi:hypothetical protein
MINSGLFTKEERCSVKEWQFDHRGDILDAEDDFSTLGVWIEDDHEAQSLKDVYVVLAGGFNESLWYHFGPFRLKREATEMYVLVHPRSHGLPRYCDDFGFGYSFSWVMKPKNTSDQQFCPDYWKTQVRESVDDAFLTGT